MEKERIYKACEQLVMSRIARLQAAMADLQADAAQETKSSSGDKHETGRAMAHLELEKLGAQLLVERQLLADLHLLATTPPSLSIVRGSVVRTNAGVFLLGAAVGKVQMVPQPAVGEVGMVFGISTASPLGSQLLGKTAGQEALVNGVRYRVLAVG